MTYQISRTILTALVLFALPFAARAQGTNTAYGTHALNDPYLQGANNTAIGYDAVTSDTAGSDNTGTGAYTLANNTTGNQNTAFGNQTLQVNTTGDNNTAVGHVALQSNNGSENTALGSYALEFNTNGLHNSAIGFEALKHNNGNDNTATGHSALISNQSGSGNTADGELALAQDVSGWNNTAVGVQALFKNTANYNTAIGSGALLNNLGGTMNVASGLNALGNNSSGSNNIALGASAGLNLTTGSNNIHIGAPGVAGESGKIRIGKQGAQSATYIAGISGKTVGSTSAAPVYVDNTGHLGTIKSSARFKQQIKPMDKASEAILKLDPVTFRYKEGLDPDGVVQFGLIAEQVEKIDARLVIRDEDGKVSTVRYEAVNAMLLNEFLKEHRKVEQLSASDADQKRESAQQQKQIEGLIASVKAQAAQIQKVSAQVHLDKSAPHLVAEKE